MTAASRLRRFPGELVARYTVELFLMLTGVLVTCYLAAVGLLLGAGVTARIELAQQSSDLELPDRADSAS